MSEAPQSVVSQEVIRDMCAMAAETPRGAFVEVGVYKGGTAWHLAKVAAEQHRDIYLFDTFTGILCADRSKGDKHVVGDFGDTSATAVKNAVPLAIVVPGVFPDSGKGVLWSEQWATRIAFAHIDVDQYRSYIETCQALNPYMRPGGVMWFDDPDCLPGAMKAVVELYGTTLEQHPCGKYFRRF